MVITDCPFNERIIVFNPEIKMKYEFTVVDPIVFPIRLATALIWHVGMEVILNGSNSPPGELILWQV